MLKFKRGSKIKEYRKKRNIKKSLLGLCIAFLIICGGGVISLVFANRRPESVTLDDKLNYVSVDEIWNKNLKEFNKQNFQKLLNYVAGESDATMDKINTLAKKTQTAEDMRTRAVEDKANIQDIIVTLGGLDWEVVYLSTDKSGNPILTLWLSNSTQKEWQNSSKENRSDLKADQGQYYGFINGGLYSDWSANFQSSSTSNNKAAFYPSNMYGASYIRAVTLNNGGKYATSNTTLSTEYYKNVTSVFSYFTMESVIGNLTYYIVKPDQVSWQENQSVTSVGYSSSWNNPNEAWSPNTKDDGFYKPDYNYVEHDQYEDWKDDYIWLPSWTECVGGNDSGGLWKTSESQRANYDGSTYSTNLNVGGGSDKGISNTGVSGTAYTSSWLRSGDSSGSNNAYYLGPNGPFVIGVHSSYAVRPALHLNLKAAANTISWVDESEFYVKLDELWDEDEHAFNKQRVQKLLDYVSGESGTTITKINTLASQTQTAEDMRKRAVNDKAADQDIIVTLGGLEWNVEYLSTDKSGNPILTLWLSNSTQKAWQDENGGNRSDLKESQGQYYGFVNGGLYSEWSANIFLGSLSNGTAAFYPSNMYGTSYIRAVTLNNGGQYATNNTTLSTSYKKNKNSVFARFTMDDAEDSLTKYIVKPDQVAWQENQSIREVYSGSSNDQNDAWSPNTNDDGFYKPDYNYAEHDHYEDWKDDYIWLPSYIESLNGGMWKTSEIQRKNYDGKTTTTGTNVGKGTDEGLSGTGSSQRANTNTWLRSGYFDSNCDVRCHLTSGSNADEYESSFCNGVRPALHLNLKSVYGTNSYIKVGEIWDGNSFNKPNVNKLIDYIAGESGTTISKINTLASQTQTAENIRSKAINDKTSDQDIIVTLGGLEWDVVYLSTDKKGNPILTLWLSNSTQKAWQNSTGGNRSDLKANQGQYYGFVDGGLYSDWSANWYNYYTSNGKAAYYPCSMYGTSYIRAVTLNNGGQYATNTTTLSAEYKKNANSVFAKFTMEDVAGSLTDFIVKPSEVSWQENQSSKAFARGGFDSPNEAWSPDTPDDAFYSAGNNYAEHDHYEDWANDYIWLPSCTECYDSKGGIWKTSQSQKENYDGKTDTINATIGGGTDEGIGVGTSESVKTASWLRTGGLRYPENVYTINTTGTSSGNGSIENANAVRPALHLNLNSVMGIYLSWQDFAADKFANETTHNPKSTSLGTKEAPFEIATAEQLALIAKDVNEGITTYAGKYFKQTANINLQAYEWKPIGVFYNNQTYNYDMLPFEGNYNGQCYHINNLNIRHSFYDCMGLFGYTLRSTIENIVVNGKIKTPDGGDIGGIVGLGSGITIQNCLSDVDINNGEQVGGIVGSIEPYASVAKTKILNCYSYGNLNGDNVGGILGFESEDVTLEKCVVICTISCTGYGGGLIGYSDTYDTLQISSCMVDCTFLAGTGAITAGFINILGSGTSSRHFLDISDCCFYGSSNASQQNPFYYSSVTLNSNNFTIKACYSSYGNTKVYTDEAGFGADCNWGVVNGFYYDLPMQKDLFWNAETAPLPEGSSSILAYLKKKGFVLYT